MTFKFISIYTQHSGGQFRIVGRLVKYVTLYQQPSPSNLIGWKLEVDMSSLFSRARVRGGMLMPFFIPRHTIMAAYYGFKLDICVSVHPSLVCPSILFFIFR